MAHIDDLFHGNINPQKTAGFMGIKSNGFDPQGPWIGINPTGLFLPRDFSGSILPPG